jgi:hypothetical protein
MPLTASIPLLSAQAKASLLTCAPGQEIYSIFGHSAIRIHDTFNGIDKVYNYGTFDYQAENFHLKFLKGDLWYMISWDYFNDFLSEYHFDNRSVIEHELNLSIQQIQHLFIKLETNLLPENRIYKYDWLFTNCSTKIRDVIEQAIEPNASADWPKTDQNQSYRQLIQPYLKHLPWIRLGINLGLGYKSDHLATTHSQMFLPNHLMYAVQHAKLNTPEGHIPLCKTTNTIIPSHTEFIPQSYFIVNPIFIFCLVPFLYGIFMITGKSLCLKILDYLLFSVCAVTGIILTWLWLGSHHHITHGNWNIVWANPLYVIVLLLYQRKPNGKIFLFFCRSCLIILIMFCFSLRLLPQIIPVTVYPVILTLLFRFTIFSGWMNSLKTKPKKIRINNQR